MQRYQVFGSLQAAYNAATRRPSGQELPKFVETLIENGLNDDIFNPLEAAADRLQTVITGFEAMVDMLKVLNDEGDPAALLAELRGEAPPKANDE